MGWLKEALLWEWASTEASLDLSPNLLRAPKARVWEVMLPSPFNIAVSLGVWCSTLQACLPSCMLFIHLLGFQRSMCIPVI